MGRTELAAQTLKQLYGEKRPAMAETDPDFAAIKERLVYGEVYPHVTLEAKLRELLILAVAATNQTLAEVRLHTEAALRAGASPEEIKEAIYHCGPYIGLGKAEAAVNAVNDVLRDHSISLPVQSQRTVSEEERLEAGIAAQKAIFGGQIDVMRSSAPANQKHIQDFLSAYCFGDIYTRSGLDVRQRELLTFCILSAQGGCESQIRGHVGGNAAVGNGKDVLLDALTVCIPYIGFPRTLNALACVNEVLSEPPGEETAL